MNFYTLSPDVLAILYVVIYLYYRSCVDGKVFMEMSKNKKTFYNVEGTQSGVGPT